MGAASTLPVMAKKKASGKNKTPRKAMMIPTTWLDVARATARANRQPVLWYVLTLIEKDARERGVEELPPMPWDEPDERSDG